MVEHERGHSIYSWKVEEIYLFYFILFYFISLHGRICMQAGEGAEGDGERVS